MINIPRLCLFKQLAIISFVCLSVSSAAQKQPNIWYLQDYGLDFNQSPPELLNEVAFHQSCAMSSASDINGNLLFYTDSYTVFDKTHNSMPNGTDLLNPDQRSSSWQKSVIIPKPGSETLFYVFMTEPQYSSSVGQSGLYYFIVDMSLNNGKGDVSVRPQKLFASTYNKLAAVHHSNRTDVWVTACMGNNNTYKTYLISAAGISAPITTSLGTNLWSSSGQLKFSPDGTMLVAADNEDLNLFDFNATTGELSNARLLKMPQFLWPDAISFSPDGTKLYAAKQSVVQYDVSSGNIAEIKASEKILTSYVNNNFYNFQLATDGKIYVTKGGGGGTSDYLGAITNPNVSGIAANVVEKYFFLQGFDSFVNWTPVFIESYFLQPEILVENTCFNDETKLSLSNTRYIQGVKWNLGEGQIQTTMDIEHTFSAAKSWDIEAEVDYGNYKVVVKKTVTINPLPEFDLGIDRTVCDGTLLTANVSGQAQYLWSTNQTTRSITPHISGLYSADTKYESTGCTFHDEGNLIINETPFVNLGPDSVVCNTPPYVLKSRTQLSNVEYKWNDPAVTGPELTVDGGKFYFLEAKSLVNGCFHRDSIFIALKFAPTPDLGSDRTIGHTESFDLDLSQFNPGTFLWDDLSTSAWRNIDGRELPLGPNTISVTVTGSNGCIGNDEMTVTVEYILGVEDDAGGLQVFPLPARKTLHIEAPGSSQVSLVTLTGVLMTEQKIESGNGSIDLKGLPDGIYILQVKSKLKSFTRKIIIRD